MTISVPLAPRSGRRRNSRLAFAKFLIPCALALPSAGECANLAFDHTSQITFDLGGMRVPQWSGGALVDFLYNQTASPTLIGFDRQGQRLRDIPLAIPGSDLIDLNDVARSDAGTWAVCGKALDHSGRGAGLIALVGPEGGQVTVIRTDSYYPTLITFAADHTLWTVGMEVVKGIEQGPDEGHDYDVLRHFDATGKLLGSIVRRSSLASMLMIYGGHLQAGGGRIGWYSGPSSGAGSIYLTVSPDGSVQKYPSLQLSQQESVDGLALPANGRAYVSDFDKAKRRWRLLSIAPGEEQWRTENIPAPLKRFALYGGEGDQLVFFPYNRFQIAFVKVQQ